MPRGWAGLARGFGGLGVDSFLLDKACPAGRASCTEGGHFVTCIPLRLVLPLVGMEIFVRDQRERQAKLLKGVRTPALRAQWAGQIFSLA